MSTSQELVNFTYQHIHIQILLYTLYKPYLPKREIHQPIKKSWSYSLNKRPKCSRPKNDINREDKIS